MLQCSYMLGVPCIEAAFVRPPFHFDEIKQIIQRALARAGIAAPPESAGSATAPGFDDPIGALLGGDPGPTVRQPLRGGRSGRSGQDRAWPGEFLSRTYAGRTGTRKYKLYVPARHAGLELPLIVMLHGCKQSPDDFAAGTRMNDLAEQHGFLVAYPAQAPNANGARCWNDHFCCRVETS